jgi:hypothetical protein
VARESRRHIAGDPVVDGDGADLGERKATDGEHVARHREIELERGRRAAGKAQVLDGVLVRRQIEDLRFVRPDDGRRRA